MSDATFERLTRDRGACANCHVTTGFFTTATRDVARVFAEATRARRSEEIHARAVARIFDLATSAKNHDRVRLLRIARVAVAAQKEADE